MTECSQCGKTINDIPWKCRRCGKTYCNEHRLPESHDCHNKKEDNIFSRLSDKRMKHSKDNHEDERYEPGRKRRKHKHPKNFNFQRFLRKYLHFRIQEDVRPHLMQFLLIFLIGMVLNYVYYQTFSIGYLFIGGVNDWFNVLIPTLNYGIYEGYDVFYLIINGIYYAYFYYSFVFVMFNIIKNLDKRDTWVMLAWLAAILWALLYFFPQII